MLLESGSNTKHGLVFLGLGSNVFFPDGVLDAHIVNMKHINQLTLQHDIMCVDSGVTLARIAKAGVRLGMKQAAFLAGIPGTLGGALKMNAGANGASIWDYVISVEVYTDSGLKTLYPEDFDVGYRSVHCRGCSVHCFLSARLKFTVDVVSDAMGYMKMLLSNRNLVQPIGTFNCGCVFRNIPGKSIGKLFDELGLKGLEIGGARISPVHANFIENIAKGATAEDVWALIHCMQDALYAAHQIKPELEVVVYD